MTDRRLQRMPGMPSQLGNNTTDQLLLLTTEEWTSGQLELLALP